METGLAETLYAEHAVLMERITVVVGMSVATMTTRKTPGEYTTDTQGINIVMPLPQFAQN